MNGLNQNPSSLQKYGNARLGRLSFLRKTGVSQEGKCTLLKAVERFVEVRNDRDNYRNTLLNNINANNGLLISNTRQSKSQICEGENKVSRGGFSKSPADMFCSVDPFNSVCQDLGVPLL